MSFISARMVGDKAVFKVECDSNLTSFSSYWWGWQALDKIDKVVQEGAIQLAGLVPGQELIVELRGEASKLEVFPIRNYTPYPVSVFKVPHPAGTWRIQCRVEALGSFQVWFRFKSGRGNSSPIVMQDISTPGEFYADIKVSESWNDIDVVKEKASEVVVISDIVCIDIGTGQRWGVIEQATRALHANIEATGRKLMFHKQSSNWSYFTCIPIPF